MKPNRLESLDTLRGFDMFWILMPTYPIFHALLVAMGLKGCWLDLQMDHLPWNGFTFYDTIYPLFLFMAGASFPYSYASSKKKGLSDLRVVWKLVKRAIILVLLGSTIFGSLKFDPKTFTLTSVLGRIGISCGLAGVIYMFAKSWRWRALVGAAIVLVAWFFPFFVMPPGVAEGALPYAAAENCIYSWADRNFFPYPLFHEGFAGCFAMVATALLGMAAGDWLRRTDVEGARKALGLVLAAVASLALGLAMSTCFGDWSVPVNKPIWSSSYVFVSGAYSLAMLGLFYWIVDVKNCRGWTVPFKAIGMNSVFAYLASRTILQYYYHKDFFFGGLGSFMPTPEWGEFVAELGYLTAYWLLLYWMYRREIFFKV